MKSRRKEFRLLAFVAFLFVHVSMEASPNGGILGPMTNTPIPQKEGYGIVAVYGTPHPECMGTLTLLNLDTNETCWVGTDNNYSPLFFYFPVGGRYQVLEIRAVPAVVRVGCNGKEVTVGSILYLGGGSIWFSGT